jgi:cytochrome c-type biogenesis protein
MKEFFVEQIFSGVLVAAFPFAFIAGVVSFLSPCVLPLVPGYLSFAAGFSVSRGKVFLGSLLFVFGFSAVFVSYGALFGGLGNQLSANEEMISRVLGLITIFLGFIFYGRFPFSPTIRPKMRTTGGLLGAPLLGVLFGIGWTPCIGPALAAVQTLAFQESSATRGAVLSFGYCSLIYRRGDVISKIGGIFLIAIGVLQVLGFWSQILNSMRSLISDFIPVI